jgi:hypothetical protein
MIINLRADLIFWKANMKIDEERGKKEKEKEKEKEKATCIKIINNYFICAPCTWRGC